MTDYVIENKCPACGFTASPIFNGGDQTFHLFNTDYKPKFKLEAKKWEDETREKLLEHFTTVPKGLSHQDISPKDYNYVYDELKREIVYKESNKLNEPRGNQA